MKSYEAMFILDTSGKPFEALQAEVQQILTKHGAEVLKANRWDERKLVYPVKRKKRGTYYLVFFKAEAGSIAPLVKECQMRESILRVLVLDQPNWEKARTTLPTEEERVAAAPHLAGGLS